MSGQYPGGFNSPVGGHRGQFNPQQLQQQMVNINQMGGVGGMQNPMGGPNQGAGMIPMSGGYGQSGMMQQQQQQQQQGNPMQSNIGGTMPPGGMAGMGVMNAGGLQSPSHVMQSQQQMNSQQQQQLQLQQQQMQLQQQQQQQQQQMGVGGPGGIGVAPQMVMAPVGNVGLMQQQQQQQQQQQLVSQQQSVQQQQLSVVAANPVTNATSAIGSHQQQQQPQAASNMLAISQPNPHKEINIVALSRLGQETVQDITSRFQEIFHALKTIQPTANRDNNTEKKVQEHFRTIRLLFKRLRIIYDKCNDGYPQGMEYTHVESLIPYKDEPDHRTEPTQCEEHRKALQENQELIETVKLKNRQLREIIDRTRIIIWEINTMLSMRRS